MPSATRGRAMTGTYAPAAGEMPGSAACPPAPGSGGVGGFPGVRVVRKMSVWPLVSPSTRLSAADEYTTLVASSLNVRLVQRRGLSGEAATGEPPAPPAVGC